MGTKIPFIRPTVPPPERWIPHLQESYAQKTYSNWGPAVRKLETALAAKYAGTGREAVLVCNATCGLTAALLAAGIRGGVLVPSFTFSASAHAIVQAGCTPVFCDVSPDSWEITSDILAEALDTTEVAAVMPVRSFGSCRDLGPLAEVAAREGLPLIVDSAASLGGTLADGTPVGGQGTVEVFSLHATKVFGIGEGGLMLCDTAMKERIRQACNFGQRDGTIVASGFNGKMSEFSAAVGLAVLEDIDIAIAQRRDIAGTYRRRLSVPWLQHATEGGMPPYQTYPVLCDSVTRVERVLAACALGGVELRRYYRPALHLAPEFSGLTALDPRHSADLAVRMLCLPVYSDMTDSEQGRVIDVILSCGG